MHPTTNNGGVGEQLQGDVFHETSMESKCQLRVNTCGRLSQLFGTHLVDSDSLPEIATTQNWG